MGEATPQETQGALKEIVESPKRKSSETFVAAAEIFEMECRSVVLAKQMLNSNAGELVLNAGATPQKISTNQISRENDKELTKFSLSPFQWILRTTSSVSPSSIFYRLENLFSPRSFESTTTALDPF